MLFTFNLFFSYTYCNPVPITRPDMKFFTLLQKITKKGIDVKDAPVLQGIEIG